MRKSKDCRTEDQSAPAWRVKHLAVAAEQVHIAEAGFKYCTVHGTYSVQKPVSGLHTMAALVEC